MILGVEKIRIDQTRKEEAYENFQVQRVGFFIGQMGWKEFHKRGVRFKLVHAFSSQVNRLGDVWARLSLP